MDVHDRGELPCDRIEEKLQAKVAQIDKQIQELTTFKQELQVLLAKWQPVSSHPDKICPIVQR